MSTAIALSPASPATRRAWWLLLAMHVPFMVFIVLQGGLGMAMPGPTPHPELALPLSILACVLQVRHSLAAAAGVRPRYWRWTLLLLAVVASAPLPMFGTAWITLQWFMVASFFMLLSPRVALALSVVTALIVGPWYSLVDPVIRSTGEHWWAFCYWLALQFLGSAALYGATRLVRLMDDLSGARADLAELAIGRERLRISRDLHDLLGQSLSAVSLKGDLAVGLLERDDVPRAVAEIEGLASVARSALHDLRDVAHREPPIVFASEIERAVDLLASTGTEMRVDIAVDRLSPAVGELFAWALREGVTNVLRHSAATTCWIGVHHHDGVVRLEIVNDGAMPASPGGSGLNGLAGRAAALSGHASGRSIGDGKFRLRVEVPDLKT